ncbi:hypothetical protein SNEBB_000894 [Seison nebaliae]|nr:hypothetical protein SNEBB_000894 [Seison nebaliae]
MTKTNMNIEIASTNPTDRHEVMWRKEIVETWPCSVKECNMSVKEELSYRQQCSAFIVLLTAVQKDIMKRILITDTAIILMHRFYMENPFNIYDYQTFATSIVFVTAKFIDEPIKLETILQMEIDALKKYSDKYISPKNLKNPRECSKKERMDLILLYEKSIIMYFNADIVAPLPYDFILDQLDSKNSTASDELRELCSVCNIFIRNCLRFTKMCVEYTSHFIAALCLTIASIYTQIEIPKSFDNYFKCIMANSSDEERDVYNDRETLIELACRMGQQWIEGPPNLSWLMIRVNPDRKVNMEDNRQSMKNREEGEILNDDEYD